jgi:serine protease
MRLGVVLFFLFSFSVLAKLDLSKKQYIIHIKSPDRLSLKSDGSEQAHKEIYEVPEELKEDFIEEMNARHDVVEIEENILLDYKEDVDDQLFIHQWGMQDNTGGIDVKKAWEISQGEKDIVVAVIDSGVLLDHADISSSLVQGADFVSDLFIANDGDGRDMDPSDPGNWNATGECGSGSRSRVSNWHGTHVAGVIAASKNGLGITGVAPNVSILPIRAMGKCGGRLNDVADAIRWAAGGTISGMPANENPAHVINLSLGGIGTCGSSMQNAIDFARSRGATIIVAVGNESLNLDRIALVPVSCRGVVNVGSNDFDGERSSFSNYGLEVDVMAPGGYRSGLGILSLSNSGVTTPNENNYTYRVGTSFAAPHVAGIAALIYSINEGLYPDQIEQALKDGALSILSAGSGSGLVQAYDTLALAEGEQPDPDFKTNEPIVNRQAASSPSIGSTYQEEIAACGSVDLSGGGGNGPGGFLPSLFFGLMLMGVSTRFKYLR